MQPDQRIAPPTWPAAIRPVRIGPFSARIEMRSVLWTTVALFAALAVGAWALTIGSSGLGLSDLLTAIRGEADEATTRILLEWRLPRVLFALVGGAALALSGAVFQSITRNPLGSPDIIGFSSGAYTGALLAGIVAPGSAAGISGGALAGGLLTGATVYLLAWNRGVGGPGSVDRHSRGRCRPHRPPCGWTDKDFELIANVTGPPPGPGHVTSEPVTRL